MVRFGIIGTNFITEKFLDAAREVESFSLAAVYSRSMEKGKEFASRYGMPPVFDSLEELAASDLIDAVYLASPTSCHYMQAVLMMNHGKHVLCEKPICSNEMEWKLMVEAARENQVVLLEAMRPAFSPGLDFVASNLFKIGTIRRAMFTYCQYSSRYDRFKEGIIENAFLPKLSNGAIMDIGVYVVFAMVRLFGMPDSIKAAGVSLSNGVNGAGTILAQYENMQAELQFSKITDGRLPCEIQGENGSILFDQIYGPTRIEIIYRDGSSEIIPVEALKKDMVYEIREFIRLMNHSQDSAKYQEYSSMEMKILDEARKQLRIVFPADTITQIL